MAPLFGGRSVAYLERYLRREETLVATARPHRDIDSSFRTPRGGSELKRSPDRHARAMLPIPDRPAPGLTTYDAKDPETSYPAIQPLLPRRARRTCWWSCWTTSASGRRARSVVRADPTVERLAAGGLSYNRFHTTALCAPTRAALLTGRNHHSVGMGSVTETATSAPGNSSLRPNTKAPLPLTLKLNGYSTAVRQVPRGPGVAVVADGAVRRVAIRRWWLRDVLRVHRWREQPVGPCALRRHNAGRASGHRRRRGTT